MRYEKVVEGTFIDRPNRFVANCDVGGKVVKCHVKNTGRCKEILIPGAKVILSEAQNKGRKTPYDLVAAYKGDLLINIDSQIPNGVFAEALPSLALFENIEKIRPETTKGDSRFDFMVVADGVENFVEVKGVTLEKDGVAMFPDAPTERGVKHLRGLIDAKREGYGAYVVLVVQMSPVTYFTPNYEMHEEFGATLEEAARAGVEVLAYDCDVTEDGLTLKDEVRVLFR